MVAAVLLLIGVFTLGIALSQLRLPLPDWATSSTPPAGNALSPSDPVGLVIPTLAVRAPVHAVGIDEHGGIEAPAMHRADETGWYAAGPTPGQHGAAVIVGHVDDNYGPAVFHELERLRTGDRIEVSRQDGSVAAFEVTDVRSFDKTALPPEVYGDFSAPELRLITCGGRWDDSLGYPENLVVYATLVE
ncbi:class F sortase [Natronosporangium hydrolyticum]|uniref:Class F sortase n=2 Tax=Natronosporangium hydrolyticum TaxID=2811111 RepID=A0A895YNT1_9ACTN|nr:class F sortase [Natronosporangium hydrolyticum]